MHDLQTTNLFLLSYPLGTYARKRKYKAFLAHQLRSNPFCHTRSLAELALAIPKEELGSGSPLRTYIRACSTPAFLRSTPYVGGQMCYGRKGFVQISSATYSRPAYRLDLDSQESESLLLLLASAYNSIYKSIIYRSYPPRSCSRSSLCDIIPVAEQTAYIAVLLCYSSYRSLALLS